MRSQLFTGILSNFVHLYLISAMIVNIILQPFFLNICDLHSQFFFLGPASLLTFESPCRSSHYSPLHIFSSQEFTIHSALLQLCCRQPRVYDSLCSSTTFLSLTKGLRSTLLLHNPVVEEQSGSLIIGQQRCPLDHLTKFQEHQI